MSCNQNRKSLSNCKMNKKHLTLKGKLPSEKLYSFFFFLLSTLHVTMLVMIVAAVATLICRIFVLGFSEIKKKKIMFGNNQRRMDRRQEMPNYDKYSVTTEPQLNGKGVIVNCSKGWTAARYAKLRACLQLVARSRQKV